MEEKREEFTVETVTVLFEIVQYLKLLGAPAQEARL